MTDTGTAGATQPADDDWLTTWWPGALAFLLPIVFILMLDGAIQQLLPRDHAWPKPADLVFLDPTKPPERARGAAEVPPTAGPGEQGAGDSTEKPKDPKDRTAKSAGGPYEIAAQDAKGRLEFGVTSAFVRLAAVAAIVVALMVLMQRLGFGMAVVAVFVLVVTGGLYGYEIESKPRVRADVVDATLGFAETHLKIPAARASQKATITDNMVVGVAGAFSLLGAFGVVAARSRGIEALRQRARGLQLLTLIGAAFLVLLVVVNKALVAWPRGLLDPASGKSFESVTNAIANYWGATGTGVLICAVVPAFLSLKADIDREAAAAAGGKPSQEAAWRKENGLEFAPPAVFATALTTAAPLLTGPVIEIVKGIVN